MNNTVTSLKAKIGNIVAGFLCEQLGEKVKSIETFQYRNKIVVYATGCFTPAEEDHVKNKGQSNLLRELKYKEFEQIQPLLKDHLEESLDLTIIRIKSLVGPGGDRVQYITLGKKTHRILSETRL